MLLFRIENQERGTNGLVYTQCGGRFSIQKLYVINEDARSILCIIDSSEE